MLKVMGGGGVKGLFRIYNMKFEDFYIIIFVNFTTDLQAN